MILLIVVVQDILPASLVGRRVLIQTLEEACLAKVAQPPESVPWSRSWSCLPMTWLQPLLVEARAERKSSPLGVGESGRQIEGRIDELEGARCNVAQHAGDLVDHLAGIARPVAPALQAGVGEAGDQLRRVVHRHSILPLADAGNALRLRTGGFRCRGDVNQPERRLPDRGAMMAQAAENTGKTALD